MKPFDHRTISALFLFLIAPALHSQALPAAHTVPGLPAVPITLEERRKALAQVVQDYWEDLLKHSPELASALGDARYNDQVTNYTSATYNDALGREQNYLMQLAVIDLAGFTDEEKRLAGALEQRFEDDQKASDSKPWETPISASGSFYAVYPQLAQSLPFATVKDYDDWTARLQALPEAFAQAMQDMSLGIDEGRVPPKEVLDKALAEVSALAHQKAEDSALAVPLKKFPSGISAAEQERIKEEILDAVSDDAQAAYLRLERFLRVSYVPAAGKGPAPAGTQSAQLLAAVLDLRVHAQQTLGLKFDGKAFHDEILRTGLFPIDQMLDQVESWITGK